MECCRLLGTAELPGAAGTVVDVSDYLAVVTGGELAAGDDAADARWVAAADLDSLPLTTGLAGYLTAWGAIPRESPPVTGPQARISFLTMGRLAGRTEASSP